MTVRLLALLGMTFACGACGGKSEDKPVEPPVDPGSASGAAEPTPPSPGLEKVRVEIGGKAIAMGRAFIKRVSPDHWRLYLADRGGSCEELLSGVTPIDPAATTFIATIRKLVASDGFESAFVTELFVNGKASDTATGTPVKLLGPADKGARTDIDISDLAHVEAPGKPKVKITGRLTAEGCGDQPADGVGIPKTAHASTATITIAGKSLPLRGAILRGDNILLSTGPKDCSAATPFAQVVVESAGADWKLAGTWIGATSQDADMKAVQIKVGKPGNSADGPVAPVELAGAGKLGGYAVTLKGKIEALDCPTE